ncbi:hypothetical protein OPV22_031047 [Ensete ventricosum]|uniref:NAC domain-containing protein n=1 Tax=Ensete ventricosum TaxID=4639 RepID=A0AAV8P0X4_ENSVE|nr:hypothetical protein OPV22_031047 [Ensete ventricosum]
MARTWLLTGRGIARKHLIDNSDVTLVWPGLSAGVRFDPSDVELLEHLAGKIGLENSKLHMLIDEFIPMLDEDEGICYTHRQNLPGKILFIQPYDFEALATNFINASGAKKDGSSIHFFHRTSNAYGTGQRKRRKINQHAFSEECVGWHKTVKQMLSMRKVTFSLLKLVQEPQTQIHHSHPDRKRALYLRPMDIVCHSCWARRNTVPLQELLFCHYLTESLLCHEVLDSFPHFEDSSLHVNGTNLNCGRNVPAAAIDNAACEFSDLDNMLIDTPPDFQLSDLQFGSQESLMSWLDRF